MNPQSTISAAPSSNPGGSAEQLLQIIRHLPDVVFQCEKRSDGRIYWTFNEGRLAVEFHLTTAEVRDRPLEALFPPDIAARLIPEFERAFRGEGREFTNELGGRFFKHYPQPVFDGAGNVVAVVGFITEVTGLVRAEETIRQLSHLSKKLNDDLTMRVLELAQTNRELETFSYTVSHDLRTPLTILENYAEVLLHRHGGELDAEAAKCLTGIQKAVVRMALLVENILRLSRVTRSEIQREDVDVSGLVEELVAELREREPHRVVDVVVAPGVRASADRYILRVALANLLANAWKFTGKAERPRVEFGAIREKGGLTFFTRDNGAGFDMRDVGRLFRLFERLHTAGEYQGTGIGLVTVQRAIHRHGGTVWASAEPGKGATFYFTLGASSARRLEAGR